MYLPRPIFSTNYNNFKLEVVIGEATQFLPDKGMRLRICIN